MSVQKSNLPKKIAAGAVLVALSGFVPKMTRNAHAASATIKASGTFSSGVALAAGNDLKFGIIVATAGSGSVSVAPGGASAFSKAFGNGGTIQAGDIAITVGATGKAIDITVTGMKNSMVLGAFNGTNTGVVNLPTVKMSGPFNTDQTFKIASTTANTTVTALTGDLNIGGIVTWGPITPIGTFQETLTVTVSF